MLAWGLGWVYNLSLSNFTCGFGCLCKEASLKSGLNEMDNNFREI